MALGSNWARFGVFGWTTSSEKILIPLPLVKELESPVTELLGSVDTMEAGGPS